MQVGTYPTRNFLYLRMVIVTTAVYWGFKFSASPPKVTNRSSLTFQHRAGVSPYTSSYDFARTCVLVNSRFSLVSATTTSSHREGVHLPGPLLPKLRVFCRVP